MAKKTGRKDTASAMKLTQELRHPWLTPVLAVFYFFVTCLMLQGCNKGITMLLLLAAVTAIIVAGERLGQRMTWPALLLGLYVLMDGISTLYAPSGKFALYEFLKVAAAACMALLRNAPLSVSGAKSAFVQSNASVTPSACSTSFSSVEDFTSNLGTDHTSSAAL